MSDKNSIVCPNVTRYLFLHAGENENPGMDKFRKDLEFFQKEIEKRSKIVYQGREILLEHNISLIGGPKEMEGLIDFYIVFIITGPEDDEEIIENPFPESGESIFERLESNCSRISEELIQTLDVSIFGSPFLISGKSFDQMDRELVRRKVFQNEFLKGDIVGDHYLYGSVDSKNRFFLNVVVDDLSQAMQKEEFLIKNLGSALAYHEKLKLFYKEYYGTQEKKSIKELLSEEKSEIRNLLKNLNEKLQFKKEDITSSELGEKNSELADRLSQLTRLNYYIGEEVDSIEADLFGLRSYMERLNRKRVEDLPSIFEEFERTGVAVLESYKDSMNDMRYLQDYLKLNSDIIQNQLEVKESKFNNFMQIAAFVVGGAILFEAVLETLLYLYPSQQSFYASSFYLRILLTIVFVFFVMLLGIVYGHSKKRTD